MYSKLPDNEGLLNTPLSLTPCYFDILPDEMLSRIFTIACEEGDLALFRHHCDTHLEFHQRTNTDVFGLGGKLQSSTFAPSSESVDGGMQLSTPGVMPTSGFLLAILNFGESDLSSQIATFQHQVATASGCDIFAVIGMEQQSASIDYLFTLSDQAQAESSRLILHTITNLIRWSAQLSILVIPPVEVLERMEHIGVIVWPNSLASSSRGLSTATSPSCLLFWTIPSDWFTTIVPSSKRAPIPTAMVEPISHS